jgi:hypothetical protein
MRQLVESTFKQPISIELLERLNLPSGSGAATTTSSVIVNPSLLSQQSTSAGQQSLLYTTVQPQQKINLLQQTPQQSFINSTPSLLGQQQQLQQQARAQIVSSPLVIHQGSSLTSMILSRASQAFVRSSPASHPRRIRTFSRANNTSNL